MSIPTRRTQSPGCFLGLRGKGNGTGRSDISQWSEHSLKVLRQCLHCCTGRCYWHLLGWPWQDRRHKACNSAQGTEHYPTSLLRAQSSIVPDSYQMCAQWNKLTEHTHSFGCHALGVNFARQVLLGRRDMGHVYFSASRRTQGCGRDKSRCIGLCSNHCRDQLEVWTRCCLGTKKW